MAANEKQTDSAASLDGGSAPCPPEPALDGAVRCKRCGHLNPRIDRCERCRSMLAGNRLAVTHALRAVDLPPELRHLRDELAAFETACLVDEGDAHDVPARRRALLHSRARVQRRIVQLDDALELRGLIDRRGRLRVAWLQRLEGLIATAVRLDGLLGLERRAKRVPTLKEYLAQRQAEASQRAAAATEGAES